MGWLSDSLIAGFYGLMLSLDSALYNLAASVYKLFIVLSSAKLLREDAYTNFVERINVIVGVAMLFVVAFSILQSIVNPDNIQKGTSGIAKNIVLSLIGLALVPTAFKYMYEFQELITTENVIGKVILGGYNRNIDIEIRDSEGTVLDVIEQDSTSTFQMAGNQIAVSVFQGFLYDGAKTRDNPGTPLGDNFKIRFEFLEDPDNMFYDFLDVGNIHHIDDIHQITMLTGNFSFYTGLSEVINEVDQTIVYKWGLSTAAAIFICYVLISFCIDMAIRAAKLAFYQLIAPIPILARIVPAGNDMFNRWIKAVISTFLDVFVKISIIFFGVFLIQLISDINWFDWFDEFLYEGIDPATVFFGNVFMIIGILLFVKQAPQLIKDVLGIKGDSLSLGIGKKLRDTPILGKAYDRTHGAVTGALGSGITGLRQGGFRGLGRGLLAGGLAGGAARGRQFGAQRTAQLQRMTGNPNAKAGFFGGQKHLLNRLTESQKKGSTTAYRAKMDRKLGDRSEGLSAEEVYNNAIKDRASELVEQKTRELNHTKYEPERRRVNAHFDSQIQAIKTKQDNPEYENLDEIKDINNKYASERAAIEDSFNKSRAAGGGMLNKEQLDRRTEMLSKLDGRLKSEISNAKAQYDRKLSSDLSQLESSKSAALKQVDINLGNEINAHLPTIEASAQKTVNEAYNKTKRGRQFISNRSAAEKATRIKDLQAAVQNIVKEEQSKADAGNKK